MRQALTRIAHRYVNILAARVAADEAGVVDGVEYLAGPPMRLLSKPGNQAAGPVLQVPESFVRVVRFTTLVVLATDQKVIGLRRAGLQAHIVVRIFRIPVEGVGQGAALDLKCNDVGPVRSSLCVNGKTVGNRGVGRNHRMPGADDAATPFSR